VEHSGRQWKRKKRGKGGGSHDHGRLVKKASANSCSEHKKTPQTLFFVVFS
jgi:hypothetical protein